MYLPPPSAVAAPVPRFRLGPAPEPARADPARKAEANALALAQSVMRLLPASEARACERLYAVSHAWAENGPAAAGALRTRLRAHCERFDAEELFATESARRATEAWCERTYALSLIRISRMPPRRPLLECVAPWPLAADDPAELQLRAALVRHFRVTLRQGDPHLGALQRAVLRFLRRRQAILRVAAATRRDLEHHAGAGAAARAFRAASDEPPCFGAARGLPDLLTELQNTLELRIAVDAHTLEIADRLEAA